MRAGDARDAVNAALLARVLWRRARFRQRDGWSRAQLEAHQARSLARLRAFALDRSPFYRRFHRGLEAAPLAELPVLTKAELMANFDDLVTDPRLKLRDLEAFLANPAGAGLYRGRYWVSATSGSTGRPGIFVANGDEWATVLASYARAFQLAGVQAGLTRRTTMAVVSSRVPWHQSSRVGSSLHSPFTPTLRLDATDPLADNVARLNAFRPRVLVAYASMASELATEQLAGRLDIAPEAVFSASEALTPAARRRIRDAWGNEPFNVYAATETAGIASECRKHAGLHLYEDLVIVEVVDADNRAVPPGVTGAKLLVTVLFNRSQPLIRYELSDTVRLAGRSCSTGGPYALLEDVEGRSEDVLSLPGPSGQTVAVRPGVFHRALETQPVGEWQVIQEPGRLRVLVASPGSTFLPGPLEAALGAALREAGVVVPVIVQPVSEFPKTTLGKAPLVRADRA